MNLSVGIVGLPNVGKSTLFNALLKKQLATVADYPFTTIEPNKGVIPVPDERLPVLAKIFNSKKIIPAVVEFYDIAGLVKGASKGEGLGNKFLGHIKEVSIICHLVRFFENNNVSHVLNRIDPENDVKIINAELILADLETLEKQIIPKTKLTRDQEVFYQTTSILKKELNKGILAKDIDLTNEQKETIKPLFLLTEKQVIYVANINEEQIKNDQILKGFPYSPIILLCAKMEADMVVLSESDQQEYLSQYGLKESGLNRLIKLCYSTLGLISFYSGNEKEIHAWTIKKGTTARQAAGVVHSDFAKNFIKADVIPFSDFVKFNGWTDARAQGKVRSEGATYQIQDGEVVEFKVSC